MQVTTEQLVTDLHDCKRRLRKQWTKPDAVEHEQILKRLENIKGWNGKTNRYFKVPNQSHLILHLERTTLYGLIASFEDLENALGLGVHEEWRGNCDTCGACVPSVLDAICFHCSTTVAS